MRRSICSTSPSTVISGDVSTWTFSYTTANDIPKGANFKFDMQSSSHDQDWEIPQTDPKKKNNLIWGEIDSKNIKAEFIETKNPLSNQFEFTLPVDLKAGESFNIKIGSPNQNGVGNRSQKYIQRKREFILHIDVEGKRNYSEKEIFHLDVKGNKLSNIKIITPGLVSRNRRFDIVVRFEDKFGNLTANAPEGTLIDLSYQYLRENLSWKLFVPETGFITLPNLYFNEPGIYRIELKNLHSNEIFYSAPIKCFADTDNHLFWGTFHSESEKADSQENLENSLKYFRDELALQFYATSFFDSEEDTSSDMWKKTSQQIAEYNEEDRFICFLGFQYLGANHEEGLHQFIYTKDNKPILRKKDIKNNSLKKIYKTYQPKEMISIPSFTMGPNSCYNFKEFNSEFEKVVEIYNAWGSSECLKKEGNDRPITNEKKKITEEVEGSIQHALNNNHRFGFVAGGLDDRSVYSEYFETYKQYPPGLTAIVAKAHTRDSIIEAINNRACFATTGKRIIIGMEIAGQPIGSILSTNSKPGLAYNRYITCYVSGESKITKLIVIRNGKIFKTFEPNENDFEISFDDSEHISQIALKGKEEKPPFIYYYVKAIQDDDHVAWGSPIWVDIEEKEEAPKIKKLKTK